MSDLKLKKWVRQEDLLGFSDRRWIMRLTTSPEITLEIERDPDDRDWEAQLTLWGLDDECLVFATLDMGKEKEVHAKAIALAWMRTTLAEFATIIEGMPSRTDPPVLSARRNKA